MDKEKEQKDVAEAGGPGQDARVEVEDVDTNTAEAGEGDGRFRTRWPDKMVQIPKMKSPVKQRVTREALAAEQAHGEGPAETYQDKLADMTILTDSESDQGVVGPAQGKTAMKGAEQPPTGRTVTFAVDEPLATTLDSRMVPPAAFQAIVEQLTGKGLTDTEKAALVEKRLDEIEKKNLYKHSVNATHADMPKVFAFEVENNIRRVLAGLLKPVMDNYRKINANVADLNTCFNDVSSSIEAVNRRLDRELALGERIEDTNKRVEQMRKEWDSTSSQVDRKLSDLGHLYKVHEDKLARYNDERTRLTQSRDQLRADIREFEKLVQELASMSKVEAAEVRQDCTEEISKLRLEIDQIMFDHRNAHDYIQAQKPRVAQLDGQIEMMKKTLQGHQAALYRMEHLEKVVAENERFLGYVLPLRIQEAINSSLVPLHEKDYDLGLSLLEHSEEKMTALQERLEVVDQKLADLAPKGNVEGSMTEAEIAMATFEKTKYKMPPFQKMATALQKRLDAADSSEGKRGSSGSASAESKSSQSSDDLSSASELSDSDQPAQRQRTRQGASRRPSRQSTGAQDRRFGSRARSSSSVGGGVPTLGSLKQRLKLKHLKISHAQILRFSSRVGRRLLKNQDFLDKLADCLDGESASDNSERAEEPWGLDDGQADLAGYELDQYSEGRLESSETEDESSTATTPAKHGRRGASNASGSQQDSGLGPSEDSSASESERATRKKVPQKKVQPAKRTIPTSRPVAVAPMPERVKKAVKRVEFVEDDQPEEEDLPADQERETPEDEGAPGKASVAKKDSAGGGAQKTKQTARQDPKSSKQKIEEHEESRRGSDEENEPEPREEKHAEPTEEATEEPKAGKASKRASAGSKRAERRRGQGPSARGARKAAGKQAESSQDASGTAVADTQEGEEAVDHKEDATHGSKQAKQRRGRRAGGAVGRSARSRASAADAEEQVDDDKQKDTEEQEPEDKQRGRRSAKRQPSATKEQPEEPKTSKRDDAPATQTTPSRRSKETTIDTPKKTTEDRKERPKAPARQTAPGARKSKESDRSPSKRKSVPESETPKASRSTRTQDRQRSEKSKEDSRRASGSPERSANRKPRSRDAKGGPIPKVVDVDASLYQIRLFMEDIQAKVAHLEKVNGVGRKRGDTGRQAASKTREAPSRKAQGVGKERSEREIARPARETPKQRKKSSSSDRSKGSTKGEDAKKGRTSPASRRSRSSSSSSDGNLAHEVAKLASELRAVKSNVKTISNQVLAKGSAGLSGGSDLLSQMALRSNEMKQTFADQREQFDLIKEEMRQELKRLQRQDFATGKGLDELQVRLEQIQQRQEAIDHNQVLQDNTFAVVFKLLRINYALMHQDELDKQNIFLVGAKDQPTQASSTDQKTAGSSPRTQAQRRSSAERAGLAATPSHCRHHASTDQEATKPTSNSIMGTDLPKIQGHGKNHTLLQFDKTCLSCGGPGQRAQQIPTLIKAFKMACLSYRPSQVVFDSRTYERNQLVEAQGYLLYLALKQLQHLDFNSADNTLLGGQPEKLLAQDFLNSSQEGCDELLQLANVMDSVNSSRIDRNDRKGNHQHHKSAHYQPFGDQSMWANDSVHNASAENSLFGGNSTEVQTNSGNPQISLSKSKEYTQLASQIPHIFGIKDGRPEFTSNESHGGRDYREIVQMVKSATASSASGRMGADKAKSSSGAMKALQKLQRSSRGPNKEALPDGFHRYDYAASTIKNQKNIYNFNTINVVPPPIGQPTASRTKQSMRIPGQSHDGQAANSFRSGVTTVGMARRGHQRREANLASTMGSFIVSTAPATSARQENQFGKARLFSVDFGTTAGSHQPKVGALSPRATLGTARGPKDISGYHASLPKVSDTSRVAHEYGQDAAIRQSFENFGRAQGHAGPLSGGSDIGQAATWTAAPKTARTGVLRGSEQSSLHGSAAQRFAETKPHFKSSVYKGGGLEDCIDVAQPPSHLRRNRQVTAPAGFDFQES